MQLSPAEVAAALARERVVPIVRLTDETATEAIVGGLLEGGCSIVELTLNTPGALAALASLADRVPVLGAGTVLSAAAAEAALDAGADFLVTPALVPEVVEVATRRGAYCACGAFTPTEVLGAVRAGASAVKWFPASLGGPRGLRELRAVFRDVPFLPTGGIDASNAREYLAAGAVAIGAGSALVGDGKGVAGRARALLDTCRTS